MSVSREYQQQQLTISWALEDNAEANGSPSALSTNAEDKLQTLLRYLTRKSSTNNGCLSSTKSGKSCGSDNQYFRYSYRESGKQKCKYIPGGNVRSPLAQKRAIQVRQAMERGDSVIEILYLIGGFKGVKS